MAEIEYRFTSDAKGDDTFTVVSFEGIEGLSRLYEYTIELKVSDDIETGIDFLDDVLDGNACFTMIYDGREYPVYGMLKGFDENQTAAGYTYYTAVLVPRLWNLTLNRDSRVYLNQNVWNIIATMLDDYQLEYQHGDVDTVALLEKDYRCQFNENDFDYISRLLENEGIFYYFDHSEGYDKIVFSNSDVGDRAVLQDLTYDSSPTANKVFESIYSWVCRKKRLPRKASIENYNPEAPSDTFISESDISNWHVGDQYTFGDNVIDSAEADYIAEIRAQEIAVNQTKYYGESGVCAFSAGLTFGLDNHKNEIFNNIPSYLITEIHHQGLFLDSTTKSGEVSAGVGIKNRLTQEKSAAPSKPQYKNSFTAIASDIQYRPDRSTIAPRFHGTISAFVYAESESDHAEIDTDGRYRVTLPFKREDRMDVERASHWVRMARPYAGQFVDANDNIVNEGMSYPLMANTEVLLTFVNGDPDRPIISSAIPNTARPELVTSENNHQTVFSTHGMYATDVRGGSSTYIWCKDHDQQTTLGAEDFADGFTKHSNVYKYNFPRLNPDASVATNDLLDGDTEYSGEDVVTERYGNEYIFIDGNTYKWDNEKAFSFGNDYEEIHEDEEGIANGETFDMQTPMQTIGGDLAGSDYSEWEDGGDGLIEKNWGDKCEFHLGRSFAWSGGQGPGGSLECFSYGNGYTENLLESSGGTSANLSSSKKEHMDYYKSSDTTEVATAGGVLMGTSVDFSGKIDPGSSTIEKTFGNTYSYQNGLSLDVKVGDAYGRTFGNAYDYVKGDSEEEVHGNAISTVHGNADNKVMGATNDMFLGAKNEMEISAANAMKLSAYTDITLGGALEVFVGGKIDISLAATMEISAGVKLEIGGPAEFEVEGNSIVAKGNEIEALGNRIDANANAISTNAAKIETNASTISAAVLIMLA